MRLLHLRCHIKHSLPTNTIPAAHSFYDRSCKLVRFHHSQLSIIIIFALK